MGAAWEMKEEYRTLFIEESQDQIREWEESLLSLEKEKGDREQMHRLFRAIHTLKGSAGFVGFDALQKLAHGLESGLQGVRDGERELTSSMLQLLLEGHDLCARMMESFGRGESFEGDGSALLGRLSSLERVAGGDAKDTHGQSAATPRGAGERLFSLGISIEAKGQEASLRAFLLQSRLEAVGRILRVEPSFEELKILKEDFKFEIVLSTNGTLDDVKRATNVDQVRLLDARETDGEPTGGTSREEPAGAAAPGGRKSEEVVRVPVEKLDTMLNLVGELVVQNSGFVSTTGRLRDRYGKGPLILDLEEKTERLANVARDLQDAVMKVRMLPVSNVFNRFHRVVRDLARDRGKKVELRVFGEETEIDKKIMDRIGEPLVHLVRNAVDHGIEGGAERVAAGKRESGRIRIGAYQEGDHICIEVSDDGRGLDRDKILKKAAEKGILKNVETGGIGEETVLGLIFQPGFSTAEKVTDVSGRGVGLDVVKRTVEEMGGVVRLSSRKGEGTTTVITLPLTMAIIPAILVEVCDALFAVPLSSVKEVIKARASDLSRVGNTLVMRLREEVLSVVELKDVLEIEGNGLNGHVRPVVVVEYGGKKVGIVVERLLGNEEIVIKSLSRHYREVEGMIGASIMGNGRIALILDVEAVIRSQFRGFRKGENGMVLSASPVPSPETDAIASGETEAAKTVIPRRGDAVRGGETPTGAERPGLEGREGNPIGGEDVGPDAEALRKEGWEALEEIHAQGAIAASIAMSQLMRRDIRVSFPETKLVPIGELAGFFGGQEEEICGIYVHMNNELNGGTLIVVPVEHACQFCDALYGRESGETRNVTSRERSGLEEMGNILNASFINAMADRTGLYIHLDVPEVKVDMCQSVVDSVLARFNQPGDRILHTEATLFYGDMEQAVCYLLMFLEPDSLSRLTASLHAGEPDGPSCGATGRGSS